MVVTGETAGCQKCVRNRVVILSRIGEGLDLGQFRLDWGLPQDSLSGIRSSATRMP